MNQKELNELRRRFKPDRTAISKVYGCYVSSSRQIISYVDAPLGLLSQEEQEMYLNLLKKTLSGALGRNLIDIVFSTAQVADSDEHRLLQTLRQTELQDANARESLYRRIIDAIDMGESSYLILLAADTYDVPHRSRDDLEVPDASETVFRYFVCAICPVKDPTLALQYSDRDKEFRGSSTGHIAQPLCEFAARCDFSVTVVDDRMDFANEGRFPLAREVICDSFENAINKLHITPYDFVVVITRGHRHDANCLRALFQQREPAYLGMIGSRRRVRGLLDMLKEEGLDEERLGQICTPIGLAIGAVSPAEIAISILSQVIEYKRLHGGMNRAINTSDLDLSVVEQLMQVQEPVALVTVVETKGSTPRGMGAMMYVYPDGRIVGSIGGGCSEAAILRDALDIIGTGTYKVIDIDMTGDVAESEGMVCGGIMKVLVEDIPLDVYDD